MCVLVHVAEAETDILWAAGIPHPVCRDVQHNQKSSASDRTLDGRRRFERQRASFSQLAVRLQRSSVSGCFFAQRGELGCIKPSAHILLLLLANEDVDCSVITWWLQRLILRRRCTSLRQKTTIFRFPHTSHFLSQSKKKIIFSIWYAWYFLCRLRQKSLSLVTRTQSTFKQFWPETIFNRKQQTLPVCAGLYIKERWAASRT